MLKTNYHLHTNFCDGTDLPIRYAEEAVKQQVRAIGYSAHAPVPFPCQWTMPYPRYQEYLNTIRSIQKQFEGELEIYCGLEIDFIPGVWNEMKTMLQPQELDYLIGSIHFVDAFADGTPWSVDGPHDEFRKGWIEIFGRDSHALVKKYFEYTRQMVAEMKPPVIGHLDKIKMQYTSDCFIADTDPVFRSELLGTLEEIRAAGSIVELNTRGVYKRNEPEFYPGHWAVKEMAKMNIPVTINADAHRPFEIGLGYEKAAEHLRQQGYKSVRWFSKGEWVEASLPLA